MTKRRKFLLGMGSLAAGGAAAIGSGAFNSANVERDANMQVTADSDAFLALNPVGDYAVQGQNGTMQLSFDGTDGAGPHHQSNVEGNGINQNSDYSFTGVFSIKNQGSQSVGVWIEDDGGSGAQNTVKWYAADSEGSDDFSNSMEGSANAYPLGVGDEVFVNVRIETRPQNQNWATLPDTVNIRADASEVPAE